MKVLLAVSLSNASISAEEKMIHGDNKFIFYTINNYTLVELISGLHEGRLDGVTARFSH